MIEYKKTESEYIPSSSRRKKRNRQRVISRRSGMSCYILELEKIQTERTAAAAVTATIVAILATRNRLPPAEIVSLTSPSRMLFPNVLLELVDSFLGVRQICVGCYWDLFDENDPHIYYDARFRDMKLPHTKLDEGMVIMHPWIKNYCKEDFFIIEDDIEVFAFCSTCWNHRHELGGT